jgi:hypothetical protein
MNKLYNLSSLFNYSNIVTSNYRDTLDKLEAKLPVEQLTNFDKYICGSFYIILNSKNSGESINGGNFSNNLLGGNIGDIIKIILCIIGAIVIFNMPEEDLDRLNKISYERLEIANKYYDDPQEEEFQNDVLDARLALENLLKDKKNTYKKRHTHKKRKSHKKEYRKVKGKKKSKGRK